MQAADQAVDGRRGVLFGHLGQMGVACSGGWTGVAEQALDMAQTQALFKQVSSKGVAQRVDRGFFLIPHCCRTAFIAA